MVPLVGAGEQEHNMSFTPGMPAKGSSLGNTRIPFVDELSGIRSTMSANHEDQNNAGAGKHKFCQFVNVADGATSATELGWYNKSNGVAQRFFMRQSSSGTIIQMSGIDPIASATAGCTFLPGGLLLQWGGGTTTAGNNDTPVLFAKNGASGFKVLAVIGLSLENNQVACAYENLTDNGFTFKVGGASGRNKGFGYGVIGTMS